MQIIVVAFGPPSTTKRAVSRARRLGLTTDPIIVVPAGPDVFIGEGMIPHAEIRPGTGSREVRRVLLDLDHQPVLLIHDDVTITPRGARALRAAYDGGNFVIPYTNERDTEQFCGPLPPARHAAPELDRVARGLDLGDAEEARLGCILAPAALLYHASGSLVVPGSSVQSTGAAITIAAAAAAHDLSCNERMLDVAGQAASPLLVATMIVKNEEERLPAALQSLVPLVDRVEICDTGSEDGTIEIARSFGANVREIGWRNDFAWARNRALETCEGADFIIFIDADERVSCDDPAQFRRWLNAWRHELDGIQIRIHSTRGEGGAATDHLAMRLARTGLVRFEGALHENLKWIEDRLEAAPVVSWYRGLVVDHEGYRPEVVAGRGKAERNIAISRAAFENEQSIKTTLDYARSLRMVDPGDSEAERLFRRALDELDGTVAPPIRAFVRATVAAYENETGNYDAAIELALQALEDVPGESLALASLSHGLTEQGRYDELVSHARRLERLPKGRPMFSIERNHHRYTAHVGRALAETGDIESSCAHAQAALSADAIGTGDLVGASIPTLVEAGVSDENLAVLVGHDESGRVLANLSRAVAPGRTAAICAAALIAAAELPAIFVTGLTAALVAAMPDEIVEVFLPHTAKASTQSLLGIADLAVRKGRDDVAAVLIEAAVTEPAAV